jgi:hypothetical protein
VFEKLKLLLQNELSSETFPDFYLQHLLSDFTLLSRGSGRAAGQQGQQGSD